MGTGGVGNLLAALDWSWAPVSTSPTSKHEGHVGVSICPPLLLPHGCAVISMLCGARRNRTTLQIGIDKVPLMKEALVHWAPGASFSPLFIIVLSI